MEKNRNDFWNTGEHPILGSYLKAETKINMERLNKKKKRSKTKWL